MDTVMVMVIMRKITDQKTFFKKSYIALNAKKIIIKNSF